MKDLICSHCGEPCPTAVITAGDRLFCCEGCRMVYQLLDSKGLCDYYALNDRPGVNRRLEVRRDKFAFLDDEKMAAGLISFRDAEKSHVVFYLPAIHCSSCLYLLENLRRFDDAIVSARIDFPAKEITIVFDHRRLALRGVAELLTSLGYEPYISLNDLGRTRPGMDRGMIYRLGVAGFCFGNIMLFSFPEYLGLDGSDAVLRQAFRMLGFLFSLPVLLYSAQPFYLSAWKGLRGKFLNIDAPIVLAIGVTFARSVWEIYTGTGSGYFDSMSGIVFFMLAGRVLQDRTYRQLSFDRDYTSYFPLSVTVLQPADGGAGTVLQSSGGATRETVKALPDIRQGDILLIRNGELIPADGILIRGQAVIDYSFVTGESTPAPGQIGELVYAGGRQMAGAIEVQVVWEVAQSYLTQLWERRSPAGAVAAPPSFSFVHALSRWFTVVVLFIAVCAMVWWQVHDPARTWKAVTAVLIVACPCALLLSSAFTNGNILRILARHHFFLRNAETIEQIAGATHIVFDKTGTLTDTTSPSIVYEGRELTQGERQVVAALAAQSIHPLSRALSDYLPQAGKPPAVRQFEEFPGMGVQAIIDGKKWTLGSGSLMTPGGAASHFPGTHICVGVDGRLAGAFLFSWRYREGLEGLVRRWPSRLRYSVLSGDTAQERGRLSALLGKDAGLFFGCSPMDKTRHIGQLQRQGEKVVMVGDGLNDAGALEQSDAGIAVTTDCSLFTPASDAILRADQLSRLGDFIRLCRSGRRIVIGSFILSVVYNVIGLFFAVRGYLSPMVAAVLMPASSLSIVLATYGSSNVMARLLIPEGSSGRGRVTGDRRVMRRAGDRRVMKIIRGRERDHSGAVGARIVLPENTNGA